ncbi:MAG: hypothetical protein IKU29_02040, partial [Parabacteroides sp.]|nr:hypothetical protein [Parabacteroides sp.]
IACQKERQSDGWDYGCACYESALKAFKSLCEDDHSGMSWSITTNILMRMCKGLPLTPITEDDLSNRVYDNTWQYQRMSSLFKKVLQNGEIKYTDVDRCIVFEKDNQGDSFYNSSVVEIVDELFPISLPYYPTIDKFKVCVETSLINPKNGDYDTRAVWWVQTPMGDRIDVNRFFTEKDGVMTEISKEEYDELFL